MIQLLVATAINRARIPVVCTLFSPLSATDVLGLDQALIPTRKNIGLWRLECNKPTAKAIYRYTQDTPSPRIWVLAYKRQNEPWEAGDPQDADDDGMPGAGEFAALKAFVRARGLTLAQANNVLGAAGTYTRLQQLKRLGGWLLNNAQRADVPEPDEGEVAP